MSKNECRGNFNRNLFCAIESAIYQRYDSVKTFCTHIGVDPSNFSRYKNGEIDPSTDIVGKMLEDLEIEVYVVLPKRFRVI